MITIPELYETYLRHPVVSTDTRQLPKGCIFFALKGPSFNGNAFAMQALDAGAAYAVVDEDCGNDSRLLRTDDVLSTLQHLANFHRHALDIHILGITGSNGKTTTKELTAAVLSRAFELHYTHGNLNNHIGVPLTLLQITEDHDFAVVEMGANHRGEIAALCRIAEPDYGLITNIGDAHLEGFGGREGVKKGKGELYDYLFAGDGLIFCNSDSEPLRELLGDYENHVFYGKDNSADYRGHAVANGTAFLEVQVTAPFDLNIKTQLTGDYNLDNVLAAVAAGSHFGVEPDDIREAIESYHPGNQRSQVVMKGNLRIVLDAYNANPSSMQAALENFAKHFDGPKMIALGEMLELGENAAREHERIADMAIDTAGSGVLLVGRLFENAARKHGCRHFIDSSACMEWLRDNTPTSGNLLIKGSRGARMEKLMDAFGPGKEPAGH